MTLLTPVTSAIGIFCIVLICKASLDVHNVVHGVGANVWGRALIWDTRSQNFMEARVC